jgi:cytochrome bd ubiquinol oxidase subunit II
MIIPWSLFFVSGVLLISLTIYVLTGGADYGGGVWDLLATGPRAGDQRELIAHAIGPIWEADHVWLSLVIVILFTAFPVAFAAIMTSLHVPVTLMLVGIVLGGCAFSFRSYGDEQTRHSWGRVFAIASLLTPLLLGVVIGAIASGQVPENPRRLADFVMPWLTPFCLSVGVSTLFVFAYLAAVYEPMETEDAELRNDFRLRAIASALAVGLMAAVVLLLSSPANLERADGQTVDLASDMATSALALGAFYGLRTRRYRIARLCAAGQATLILWGWAFAQFPCLVEPNLTIYNTVAPPLTIRLLAAALALRALLALPSHGYLLAIFKSRAHKAAGVRPRRRLLEG